MGVCIRLQRLGASQKPYYRVVVADGTRATQGKALDGLGTYDPRAKDKPLKIDTARLAEWRSKGAALSPSVARLFKRAAALQKA